MQYLHRFGGLTLNSNMPDNGDLQKHRFQPQVPSFSRFLGNFHVSWVTLFGDPGYLQLRLGYRWKALDLSIETV